MPDDGRAAADPAVVAERRTMKVVWTFKHHVVAWLTLFVFAASYLAFLFFSHVGDARDRLAAMEPQSAETPATLSGVAAPQTSDPARDATIEEMRTQIAGMRQKIEALKREDAELRRRLELVESAFGPSTASLPPQSEEPRITGALQKKTQEKPVLPVVTVKFLPLPEDGFGDAFISASPIPVAGIKAATQTLFGVELANAASAEDLKKRWTALNSKHAVLLGGLQARSSDGAAAESGQDGKMKLIAGPFPNAAGAARLCARLRAVGASCKETVFAGKEL